MVVACDRMLLCAEAGFKDSSGKRYAVGMKRLAPRWAVLAVCAPPQTELSYRQALRPEIQILPETALARAGGFVIFDFSRVGIVVADQEAGSDFVETVEGNTNGKSERDSESGDGVWRKRRKHELTKCYIRVIA